VATRDSFVLSPIVMLRRLWRNHQSPSCVPDTIPVLPCRFKFDRGTPVASKRLTAQKRVTPLNLLSDPSVWADQGPGRYPVFKKARCGQTPTDTQKPPCCCHYHRWGGTVFGRGEMHVETHESGSKVLKKSNHGAICNSFHFWFTLSAGRAHEGTGCAKSLRLVHKLVTGNVNDDLSCELLARPFPQVFTKE
jgi:hypothetical protein